MFRLFYLLVVLLTFNQDVISSTIASDCTHLILPTSCQCYHSGDESQLDCHSVKLNFLPRLTNNMRWNALDFSKNNLSSIDSYIFSDIYIEKLDLKLNSIQFIELTAFEQIKNLKQLFINHNKLNQFDPKILSSLNTTLEIFDMSYNPFGYLNLGEILFYLPYLKQFHAVSCQLNDSSLYTLLKLNNLPHYSLELIDLSYNNLSSLCNKLFDGFYKLIELRLNNNNIYQIDNYFIKSLNYLKTVNLAFNSIQYVPNIFSSSLESLNFSSNNIRYLSDYFASNLLSIRLLDFDSNRYLNFISPRAFCFLNISTLEKLSFRSNNILSLNTFSELLCRLSEKNIHRNILDLNHNMNLKCDCMLIQFEKYLINYLELTCTKQKQDRYFISKEINSFSNCSQNICLDDKKNVSCQWTNAEQLIIQGTCIKRIIKTENSTKIPLEFTKTTIDYKFWENITNNLTLFNDTSLKSYAVSINRLDYIYFFIIYFTFRRF